MATLSERKNYREAILKALYEATEVIGSLASAGRSAQRTPDPPAGSSAACAYLTGEGLVTVDWEQGNTPAMVTLTHQGIRLMESGEEERG